MSRVHDSAGAKVPKPQELIIGWEEEWQGTGVQETSKPGSALYLMVAGPWAGPLPIWTSCFSTGK